MGSRTLCVWFYANSRYLYVKTYRFGTPTGDDFDLVGHNGEEINLPQVSHFDFVGHEDINLPQVSQWFFIYHAYSVDSKK